MIAKCKNPESSPARRRTTGAIAILCLAFILIGVAPARAEKPFTVNTADQPPYSTPDNAGIYDRLITAVFDRLGVKLQINHLPSARSLENVNLGWDDAEYARIAGLERQYPNLIMVNEKLIDFAFTAFGRNPAERLTGWADLAGRNVAYMRGWKIYERRAEQAKTKVVVSSEGELFEMLRQGRVDLALYELYRGRAYLKKHGLTGIHNLQAPLAVRGMYMYVHKKHGELVPRIEKALRALKDGGEYKAVVDRAISR